MITLVEDLDEITKLESGTIEMHLDKVNLVELINDVIASLEMSANKRNVTVKFNNTPLKSVWVKADRDRINQVLVN